jgi:hypothetical protein
MVDADTVSGVERRRPDRPPLEDEPGELDGGLRHGLVGEPRLGIEA